MTEVKFRMKARALAIAGCVGPGFASDLAVIEESTRRGDIVAHAFRLPDGRAARIQYLASGGKFYQATESHLE